MCHSIPFKGQNFNVVYYHLSLYVIVHISRLCMVSSVWLYRRHRSMIVLWLSMYKFHLLQEQNYFCSVTELLTIDSDRFMFPAVLFSTSTLDFKPFLEAVWIARERGRTHQVSMAIFPKLGKIACAIFTTLILIWGRGLIPGIELRGIWSLSLIPSPLLFFP